MPTLTLKLKDGIEFEHGGPVFTKWLPTSSQNKIRICEGNLELVLWLEEKDFFLGPPPPKKEIKNHINMSARCIYVEIKAKKITKKLASYIENYDPKKLPNKDDKNAKDFKELGENIYLLILRKINRLIDYTRTEKAQYWLHEKEVDTGRMQSFYTGCGAICQIDNGAWKRFRPTSGESFTICMPPKETSIKKNDWPALIAFIQGDSKSDLVKSLLAGAEKLENNGHRRSALTESISALELALFQFSKQPSTSIISKNTGARINLENLHGHVKHLGFTATLNYLLPLLFKESQLSSEEIQNCQKALAMRNNVIHNGQRDVNGATLRNFLRSIRKCCETLALFTKNTST